MAHVVVDSLTKVFKGPKGERVVAVDHASLEVKDREFLVLVGPSGCGKSTTLRMIAGLEEPTEGTISIDGQTINGVSPGDRDIAMVFQNHALYPHMTVFENMAFGLRLRKIPRAGIEERVAEAAGMLELRDCLDRKPAELSGGQRQRVAVGRAIVRKPKVFLFDEPLSNLDAPMRAQMRREISRLHEKLASTMIYVTHDQAEAMTMGDRIAVMKSGSIQQADEPMSVYRGPANLFVAGFIGVPPMNFFRGTIVQQDGTLLFREQPPPGAVGPGFAVQLDRQRKGGLSGCAGRKVVLGLRPEDIQPVTRDSAPDRGVEAVVEALEPMGPETHLYANSGAHSFVARSRGTERIQPGQKFPFEFDMSRAHFFDPHTEKAMI
jgi:multiple sugar transport system ATP-binding protein